MAAILATSPRRRCDETCHRATSKACGCICGGRYHGKGAEAPAALQRDLDAGLYGEQARIAARIHPVARRHRPIYVITEVPS